jgi:AcrR family transcriptional regulator
MESDITKPQRGWRERKKAKTKAAIQQHALRLFREQGYDATTVEQIAEASEISPSTFFRYFPNKEDVVIYDDLDPLIFAAVEAQPAELSPIEALRRAFHEVLVTAPATEVQQQWERWILIRTVPELRMRFLDQVVDTLQVSTEMLARRMKRSADDFAVRVYTGALIGAIMGAMLTDARALHADPRDPQADLRSDFVAMIDDSLALLEAGLPLD